jgi:N-methylhydantoinase A
VNALGIDVGGTFTDAVLVTDDGMVTAKVLSTERQEEGVVEAARAVLEKAGVQPRDVGHFVHGSTVATNALLTRSLARTALVTTKGFRDLLFLGRQARPSLYRLHEAPTPPVVERRRCVEVDERMGPDGVIRELDEPSVHRTRRASPRSCARRCPTRSWSPRTRSPPRCASSSARRRRRSTPRSARPPAAT